MEGRYKLEQELNKGSSPKYKMYLQRNGIAHWLPSRVFFASLQACARQTWKEREISQYSETLVQPTTTCSSSLKDNFVFQSIDKNSFLHYVFSQMWCKAPTSPSLLCAASSPLTWAKIQDKGPGGTKEFLLQLNSLMTEGQHCLTASGHGWKKHPDLLTASSWALGPWGSAEENSSWSNPLLSNVCSVETNSNLRFSVW